MNIQKILSAISASLVITGFSVVAPIGVSWIEKYQTLTSATAQTGPVINVSKPNRPDATKGTPRRIIVPSLGIDAEVADGTYNSKTGDWTITEDAAYFAVASDPANSEDGNTFIYGHNSQKIFGKLLNITENAQAIVTTDNGYEFTYKYTHTEAVKPNDVAVLQYSGKPRLTLQTCSGFWHQNRQMFYFELVGYKKV